MNKSHYKNARELVKCIICGELFKARKDRPNITCSFNCNLIYRRTIKNTKLSNSITTPKLGRPKKVREILKCDQCGIGHERRFNNKNKCGKIFCSRACYINYIKSNNTLTPIKQSLKISYICKYCGCSFLAHKYRKNVQYCSINCSNNDFRRDFRCKTCGKFVKIATHRENKYCSIECANKGVDKRNSKFAKDVFKFLSNNFKDIECEKYIKDDNKRYSIDFVIDNYAIECYGDYWHCNPKKYDERYYNSRTKKTAKETWNFDKLREEYLMSKGYYLIIIWETDWYKDPKYRETKIKEILNEVRENKIT